MSSPSRPRNRLSCLALFWTAMMAVFSSGTAEVPSLVDLDFREPAAARGWKAVHDVGTLQTGRRGLVIPITGSDPYLHSPVFSLGNLGALWLELSLWSEEGGSAQVFFFQTHARERDSVRFSVPSKRWYEARVPLPPLTGDWTFRFDPPGRSGRVFLRGFRVRSRVIPRPPQWPEPRPPLLGEHPRVVSSGDLELRHARDRWDAFEVRVAGKDMAVGHTRPVIGYLRNGTVRWIFSPAAGAGSRVEVSPAGGGGFQTRWIFEDPDGGRWVGHRSFTTTPFDGVVQVETTLTVDHDRSVIYLPMFTLLPGLGSFGPKKDQAIFSGLEYLADEPSSNELDVVGPASRRQVPDSLRVTFPLMALEIGGRYIGLIWDMAPEYAAVFDSPDRFFGSPGHLMGVLFPGSNGGDRDEGSLLPYGGAPLRAHEPLELRVYIIGGKAENAAAAIQKYVELKKLPSLPEPVPSRDRYLHLAAAGWLDSAIRVGNRFRHAVWRGAFGPAPAPDAAVMMTWLAGLIGDVALKNRLLNAASEALQAVDPAKVSFQGVSHVRPPVASLVFGSVGANVKSAARRAEGLLGRFSADGTVRYEPGKGGRDYGRTHFAAHANGLTSRVVLELLEAAAFSGRQDLIRTSLERLDGLERYQNGVPRGAQTWEVPLHTPDILAAAQMVKAFAIGYELTGKVRYLAQARYWAWTGVPFVYLRNPTAQPIGPYGTIPVFGATHWTAPVWMGLPVQWCGMVYADALRDLARYHPGGIWKQLADGITAAGIQYTFPLADAARKGLLPDVFHLRSQTRDGPAINPGTVQSGAIPFYGGPRLYDFRVARASGLMVHAPGEIRIRRDEEHEAGIEVAGWPDRPYYVLLHGVPPGSRVTQEGKPIQTVEQWDRGMVLSASGRFRFEVRGF